MGTSGSGGRVITAAGRASTAEHHCVEVHVPVELRDAVAARFGDGDTRIADWVARTLNEALAGPAEVPGGEAAA